MMSAKFLNSAVGILTAFLAVTFSAWDQDPIRDGLADDLISPWCSVGSPESWKGMPCALPLRTGSADATAVPR